MQQTLFLEIEFSDRILPTELLCNLINQWKGFNRQTVPRDLNMAMVSKYKYSKQC